ncbi:MAG: GntR family transcriptional regulator [Lachnospiraceae bacterium]|nr:GntR family transcriptional regulator [Lachnospiraceae bacterium]MCI9151271.1 GntR family transcriptional regulator [Lachnospiraceae bacterium]
MPVIKRVSLVDQVYDKIRKRIIALEVPFGSKLNVSKLQEEYGVSSTPVREALNRLLNEGLIEFENNVGASVVNITETDVIEVQELEAAYEMAAVRYAMQKGDHQSMAEEIQKHIEDYRITDNLKDSCTCIRRIKDVFYRNARNQRLASKSTSLSGVDDILHTLFTMQTPGEDHKYHSGIMYFEKIHQAVLENDFAKVCDGLDEHREWSRIHILRNLEYVKGKMGEE